MSTRREFLWLSSLIAAFGTAKSAQIAPGDSVPSEQMPSYRIGATDLVAPRLAFGCAMSPAEWKDPQFVQKTAPVIEAAYENGITFFDTADIYGGGAAELALGEVLMKKPGMRDRVVVQSKCGVREGFIDTSRAYIIRSVHDSLQRLHTDHLDILLLHWPDVLVESDEVATAFDELHRAGKVRYFGVSNHNPVRIELLKKSLRQPLVINQIRLGLLCWFNHLPYDSAGANTLDYCHANGIHVQAHSPLKPNLGARFSVLSPTPDASPQVKQTAEKLAQLGEKYSVRPAAIMLAWLMRHPARITPVFGTTKVEHVRENRAATHVNLTHAEWYELLQTASLITNEKVA